MEERQQKRRSSFLAKFKRQSSAPSSTTEEKVIKNKLDELARTSQNPLFGIDVDDDELQDATMLKSSSEQFGYTNRINELKSDKGLSKSEPNLTSIERDITNGLPPAAALWYSPTQVKTQSASLKSFEPSSKLNDNEKKIAQLKSELDHINSILQKLDEQLRETFWKFEQSSKGDIEGDLEGQMERETRKIREDTRSWELKQWKIIERIDKITNHEEGRSQIKEQDKNGNDIKILTIHEGKKIVSAATLNGLVSLLIDESNSDLSYGNDFLLTFRMYMSSKDVLSRFKLAFHEIENKDTAILRVAAVLKKWMERSWVIDFEMENIVEEFQDFFHILLLPYLKKIGKDSGEFDLPYFAKYLSAFHRNKRKQRPHSMMGHSQLKSDAIGKLLLQNLPLPKGNRPVEVIALSLSAKELELYSVIKGEELLEKLIYKGEDISTCPKSPGLNQLISWVNHIGYWLGNEICMNYDLKGRVKILTRFVEIAQECANLGSYNTVFAIITGLNNSSIMRLKHTWAELPKKTMATFTGLDNICSPQLNYRNYRVIEANAKPPFIPFFGMHMKDLLFMNDGKPSKISPDLYSFEKLRTMAATINSLLKYQKQTFHEFPRDEGMEDYLLSIENMKILEDRHLYKLSCLCEPPTWKRKSFFVMSRRQNEL